MFSLILEFLGQSWLVLGDMAPYLLFGFALAGLLSIWISPEWTERHLGGRGFGPVLNASLLGIPLPLCSCSVIPVVASMRRHGASRAAATSFLLSTPQTGVDSIAVTYALLGPVFALFRPVAALISGVLGGGLVLMLGRTNTGESGPVPACTDACCSGDRSAPAWQRAARYGFVTLPRDLAVPLLIGVLVAGGMAALIPADSLHRYLGGGILSILAMMALGIPLYVCATASVPIAAGLIHLGASPGAALAFLIAGPATNAAALATVWKVFGRRTTLVYLLTVVISAVLCGLTLDLLAGWVAQWLPQAASHLAATEHAAEHADFGSSLWAIVLLGVLVGSRLPIGREDAATAPRASDPAPQPQCDCCRTDHAEHGHGK